MYPNYVPKLCVEVLYVDSYSLVGLNRYRDGVDEDTINLLQQEQCALLL
jgi:hypothetical protein